MKRIALVCMFLVGMMASAIEKVSMEEILQHGWEPYVGKTIEITTPLYVVGNNYDSLILAAERIYCAEEHAVGLAEGDSTQYWEIRQANREKTICLNCKVTNYKVRTGAVIRGLQAKVTAPRKMLTGKNLRFAGNKPERKPKMGAYDLLVCGANIENFFYDLGGYASKRTTREQHRLQTEKVAKGLRAVDADVYGICEMQKGDHAPTELVAEMNRMAKADRYAYIDQGWSNGDTVGCCYIYRKDKVRPYGETLFAYKDKTSAYAYRLMAQGFEDLQTGERIVVSVNHLKSKRANGEDTNSKRMQNVDSLLVMLEEAVRVFGDSDIVLVGDYNCYTQEQPIQTIVKSGYADVLMQYAPENYSYVYKGECGYLDRCFATESMAGQVVNVQPWHLNADYYYSRGFKRGLDKTMYRYSDHDPILVAVRLKSK